MDEVIEIKTKDTVRMIKQQIEVNIGEQWINTLDWKYIGGYIKRQLEEISYK